jgi:hypothetical protein
MANLPDVEQIPAILFCNSWILNSVCALVSDSGESDKGGRTINE